MHDIHTKNGFTTIMKISQKKDPEKISFPIYITFKSSATTTKVGWLNPAFEAGVLQSVNKFRGALISFHFIISTFLIWIDFFLEISRKTA